MLQRNIIFTGLLVGIAMPLAIFAILYNLLHLLEIKGAASGEGFATNFRERTVAIAAIAFNVFPMRIYQRKKWDYAMRGIVVATGILAIAWLIMFGKSLL